MAGKKTETKKTGRGISLRTVRVNPTVCPHCAGTGKHRVTNTYPNERRRVICADCGLPFIIFKAG